MYLNLRHKTGFAIGNNRMVRIYEKDGRTPFYFFDAKKLPFAFNLPPGEYFTVNDIVQQAQARKYKLPEMPRRERSGGMPDNVRVVFRPNPNKASIFRDQRLIVIDPQFWQGLNRCQRSFVRLHEVAHYYYKTDEYCDLYAERMMLKMGYNPSQVALAVATSLGNTRGSMERKFSVLDAAEDAFNL